MMRALLLGAFATTAFAADADCPKDVSVVACRGLATTSDFNVEQDAASFEITLSGKHSLNGATQYVGTGPWNKNGGQTDLTVQPDGCVTTLTGASPTQAANAAATNPSDTIFTCHSNPLTSQCDDASAVTLDTDYTMKLSLQNLVANLDDAGRFALYFQKVLENPISGSTLQWISQNACKLYVDVEFECSGSSCVEVTTIVCASFAGITTTNEGSVSIECKVPSSFTISSTDPDDTVTTGATVEDRAKGCAAATQSSSTTTVVANDGATHVWAPKVANTRGVITFPFACGSGVCTGTQTTALTLGEGDIFHGGLNVQAYVQAPGGVGWTTATQPLYCANYNLSRASDFGKTFEMPVNVLFHSDAAPALKNAAELTDPTFASFNSASTARPFLAKSEVSMGALVNHRHAYLQIVAKVNAPSSTFSAVKVQIQKSGCQNPADCRLGNLAAATPLGTNACSMLGNTLYHTDGADSWPKGLIQCDSLMAADHATNDKFSSAVVPGDTLVISLQWKLLGSGPSTSGKAQLLQDSAEPTQSVEVSLTIQLGGGETTITTAGASDASADQTVTYIIIAVVVVAAGLILAVVVVTFFCLRNRSQEQLVSMSPQKCTVAAVYDISQPKKADAMDV